MACDSGANTCGQRGDGAAPRYRMQVGAIRGEIGEPLRWRRVAFVGDVVGGAREAVDRGDRRAQRAAGTASDATGKFS